MRLNYQTVTSSCPFVLRHKDGRILELSMHTAERVAQQYGMRLLEGIESSGAKCYAVRDIPDEFEYVHTYDPMWGYDLDSEPPYVGVRNGQIDTRLPIIWYIDRCGYQIHVTATSYSSWVSQVPNRRDLARLHETESVPDNVGKTMNPYRSLQISVLTDSWRLHGPWKGAVQGAARKCLALEATAPDWQSIERLPGAYGALDISRHPSGLYCWMHYGYVAEWLESLPTKLETRYLRYGYRQVSDTRFVTRNTAYDLARPSWSKSIEDQWDSTLWD